jgi:predicted ATPase
VLLGALDDAIGGRGGVALVFGDAGIGKTTVARQFAEDATARGAECVWATCWDDDTAPAFWPWVQVLRTLHDLRPDLVRAETEVAVLLPELGDAKPAQGYARHEPEEARFRLFDLVTRLILSVAAGRPLVIVLEDLHWSDDASLSPLDFLGRELERAPVFVVGTYRDVDVAAHGPLARLLNRTASMAMRLPLGPLDPAGVGALVRQLSDSEPSVQLATDLHRRTGGNPLFVREVVRLAQAQGASLTDHVVPAGVRAVIERRVARLPQATHELLATAAVIGLEFDVEMLADLGAISTA